MFRYKTSPARLLLRVQCMKRDKHELESGPALMPNLMQWRARPDMACDYLSEAWLEFTGYSAEQALGHGWSRGVHPENLPHWLERCLPAFDPREPFEVEYRLPPPGREYRSV